MASALIGELKTLVTEVGESDMEDLVGTSWAALAGSEDPHARGLGTLLVEVGAIGREGRRGRGQARWGEGGERRVEEKREPS